MTTSGSGSGLLLVTRLNDNHSAVPVVGKFFTLRKQDPVRSDNLF